MTVSSKDSIITAIFLVALLLSAKPTEAAPKTHFLIVELSESALAQVLDAVAEKDISLTSPAGASLKIDALVLDLKADSSELSVVGDIVENSGDTIPVEGVLSIEFIIAGNELKIKSTIDDFGPRHKDIPLFSFRQRLKALFLDNIDFKKPPIDLVTLPIQTEIAFARDGHSFRSNQKFGDATADVVATVNVRNSAFHLRLEKVQMHDGWLTVILSTDTPDADPQTPVRLEFDSAAELPEGGIRVFVGGRFLADVLNTLASDVQIPFFVENPRGWIDGKKYGKVLGSKKEWYVEFEGDRPLSGQVNMSSIFSWSDALEFRSSVVVDASGRIHGHYDPGPGGGCGDRANAYLRGQTELNGLVVFSAESENLSVDMIAAEPGRLDLNYHVESVSLCGVGRKGPFNGTFRTDIPTHDLLAAKLPVGAIQGKLDSTASVTSKLVALEARHDGIYMDFDLKVSSSRGVEQ